MKAAHFTRHGDSDVMVFGDVPTPEAGPGEVRVRVRACALNHLDLFVRRGIPGLDLSFPHVGCSDMAGEIDSIGSGVSGWSPGERVLVNPSLYCGTCAYCHRGEHSLCDRYRILGEHVWGGGAEFAVVPVTNLLRLPEDVSFTDAAAVPLTFQTAWRALFTRAGLSSGETILILGASGGVAVAAIQMARMTGAAVFAVTSGHENASRVRALGADVVIDRLETDFSREVWSRTGREGVDVVLENTGAATWEGALKSLKRGGRLVTYGATTGNRGNTNLALLFWKQISILGSTMAGEADFRHAMRAFLDGRLRAVVSDVMPLAEIRAAHEKLERGEQFGKIVLTVG